jgi:hypothetical protein
VVTRSLFRGVATIRLGTLAHDAKLRFWQVVAKCTRHFQSVFARHAYVEKDELGKSFLALSDASPSSLVLRHTTHAVEKESSRGMPRRTISRSSTIRIYMDAISGAIQPL